jgi:hypothetical protein
MIPNHLLLTGRQFYKGREPDKRVGSALKTERGVMSVKGCKSSATRHFYIHT